MKKISAMTLILCLLTSCTNMRRVLRGPASLGLDGNCVQLAAPLIQSHSIAPTEAENILEDHLSSELLSRNLAEKYRFLIRESEIDAKEAYFIRENIAQLPTDEKLAERLFSYIQFARSRGAEREKILNEVHVILGPEYKLTRNHWVKSFKKIESKVTAYIDKREKLHFTQFQKTTDDETRARWSAWKTANEEGKLYRSLSLKCSNKTVSSTTPEQAKLLTRAFTAGSIGSAVATYSFINWDKEKDGRWYGELGWTLFWASLFGFVNGKYIFSNPHLSPWTQRMPLTFAVAASEDALISSIYGPIFQSLFGAGVDTNLEKLENIKNDPQAQRIMSELYQIMQEEGLVEKYQAEMRALFSKKDENGKWVPLTLKEVSELDPAELDIELGQDMFLEAMAEQEYRQSMGPLSFGGSASMDRYSFHRMLDFIYVPLNIQLGLVMNHQICMSPNPKVGMLKAVSTFMAGKMLMDTFYFWSRRQAIGQ